MLKKLSILAIVDFVLILIWAYWAAWLQIESMAVIGVILLVPALIIVSGLVGLVLHLKKNTWAIPVLINMIIATLLFIGVMKYWGWKDHHDHYLDYYFSESDKIFFVSISLNKGELQDGLKYNIYERLGEYGNAGTDLDGTYETSNDTIVLKSDKGKVMKIFKKVLFDYPKIGELRHLRKSPE